MWTKYWFVWFLVMFGTFIIPELYVLARGQWRNTLSAQVWKLEGQINGPVPLLSWTAIHFLLGGAFIVTFLWLIGHFVFGMWR